MLWTCKLLLTDLIKAAYQVPFGDFMQYQIYCITRSADSYCPSKWGTTKRYFSRFPRKWGKINTEERKLFTWHRPEPLFSAASCYGDQEHKPIKQNTWCTVYLQVTIKSTQMIPYRPQKKAEGKGFFFLLLPFSCVFPWPNQRLRASETSCPLDKTGEKKNPSCAAVRLKVWSIYRTCWDFWMLALPNTEGNSEKSCCQGRRATHPAWSGCSAFLLQLPQPAMRASVNQPPGHAHVGSPAREHPQNYS